MSLQEWFQFHTRCDWLVARCDSLISVDDIMALNEYSISVYWVRKFNFASWLFTVDFICKEKLLKWKFLSWPVVISDLFVVRRRWLMLMVTLNHVGVVSHSPPAARTQTVRIKHSVECRWGEMMMMMVILYINVHCIVIIESLFDE